LARKTSQNDIVAGAANIADVKCHVPYQYHVAFYVAIERAKDRIRAVVVDQSALLADLRRGRFRGFTSTPSSEARSPGIGSLATGIAIA